MARLTISKYSLTLKHYAGVLELVDNADLKSVGRKPVRVQVPPPAPKLKNKKAPVAEFGIRGRFRTYWP